SPGLFACLGKTFGILTEALNFSTPPRDLTDRPRIGRDRGRNDRHDGSTPRARPGTPMPDRGRSSLRRAGGAIPTAPALLPAQDAPRPRGRRGRLAGDVAGRLPRRGAPGRRRRVPCLALPDRAGPGPGSAPKAPPAAAEAAIPG